MGILSSLNREQKEAVGLLQIGTFLEYFDLMLYVHMAVLLNELFFPTTDPHTASLLSALAFCSTFLLRPFGALIFGYIGDHIGRKSTVIITTIMMSVSCIIMANLPTYAQIGITASWLVTVCRMVQGLSSMGEIVGADLYLTEITKPPARYPIVALTSVASSLGSVAALLIGSLVHTANFNWRFAFWVGAGIAVVGSIARTRLRETPDFADMKRRLKQVLEKSDNNKDCVNKRLNFFVQQKINKENIFFYFFIQCGWPISFYVTYIYCGNLLKTQFGYAPEQIINHNFYVGLAQLFGSIFFTILCTYVHPLKIVKNRAYGFALFAVAIPLLLYNLTSPLQLFLIQAFMVFVKLSNLPAVPVFLIKFPVYRRFTCDSFVYSFGHAFTYVVTSFGLVYLTEPFGHYGLWGIMIPITVSFLWAVHHFDKLEKASGNFPEPC